MILLQKKKTKKMRHLKRGRLLLLGAVLDENVKRFSLQQRKKGGVVNTVVAVATTKELKLTMISDDDEDLKLIDLESTAWAKSFFQHMGFCKCAATTLKVEIPEFAKGEAKFL